MFFLLRCTFWLGLVFAALPATPDGAQAPAPGRAVVAAAAKPDRTIGDLIGAKIEELCLSAPRDCIETAGRLQRVLFDPGQPAVAKPAVRPAAAQRRHADADTLTPVDVRPAWHGARSPRL